MPMEEFNVVANIICTIKNNKNNKNNNKKQLTHWQNNKKQNLELSDISWLNQPSLKC